MDEFVSEPIEPAPGAFDAAAMARGEPGLPDRFAWRGTTYALESIVRAWKTSTRERGELYLRRHWYEVRTAAGPRMMLYCERQAKSGRNPKRRWWLYSIGRDDASAAAPSSSAAGAAAPCASDEASTQAAGPAPTDQTLT